MKFYNALLLLAATLTLTLGNGLDVSDLEEENIGGNILDDGFGESSEPEFDHNSAPVEPPSYPTSPEVPTTTPIIVPPSFPSVDNNTPSDNTIPPAFDNTIPPSTDDSIPPAVDSTIPTTSDTVPPTTDDSIPPPVENTVPATTDESIPPVSDNVNIPIDSTTPEQPPSAEGISGQNIEDAENSDDYGNTEPIDQIDNTNVSAEDANGENSDDYGNSDPIDQIDNTPAEGADQLDGVDAANAEDENNSSDVEDNGSSNGGKVAGGLAGVAALSSAGLFYYIKRSKHAGLESVRTQITMV